CWFCTSGSGRCNLASTWAVLAGGRWAPSVETSMVTTSTNGTAHSAGYCSTVAVNPACVKKCPASSAPSETNPPVTIPAMAPDTVNPRHQIAKSTTGANDEAVKVKTMATAPARANPVVTNVAMMGN